MHNDFTRLKHQGRILRVVVVGLAASGIMAAVRGQPDVVRTHGLVILDDQGRERVLLGSPTPRAPRRSEQSATSAIVFRSKDGKDRPLLGEEPDPVIDVRFCLAYRLRGAACGSTRTATSVEVSGTSTMADSSSH